MDIRKYEEDGKLVIAPKGRLDTASSPEMEQVLDSVPAGTAHLILDFAGLDYISSAGLRLLLITHKRMIGTGGELTVRNVNETIAGIFEVTGFAELLNVE